MVTLKDIANKAGVSSGIVSRILSNDHNLKVSPDTRKRCFVSLRKCIM